MRLRDDAEQEHRHDDQGKRRQRAARRMYSRQPEHDPFLNTSGTFFGIKKRARFNSPCVFLQTGRFRPIKLRRSARIQRFRLESRVNAQIRFSTRRITRRTDVTLGGENHQLLSIQAPTTRQPAQTIVLAPVVQITDRHSPSVGNVTSTRRFISFNPRFQWKIQDGPALRLRLGGNL